MNLALGLPRLPRAARRELASRKALHAWLLDLQRPRPGAALARFLVPRLSEWPPLQASALVVADSHAAERLGSAPRGRRLSAAVAVADAALPAQAPCSAGSMRGVLRSGPDTAAVARPRRGREEGAGVLGGIDDTPAPWPPDVFRPGEALRQDVLVPLGLALARVRHLARLGALATIDDLTGRSTPGTCSTPWNASCRGWRGAVVRSRSCSWMWTRSNASTIGTATCWGARRSWT